MIAPDITGLEIVADDWGFSKGINDGILELAKRRTVTTVSLVANSPNLDYRLNDLLRVPNIKLAFHLNLTAGIPLTPGPTLVDPQFRALYPLKKFLWRWMTSKIDPAHVTEEAEAQLKKLLMRVPVIFEADGHEHVHLIPGVLDHLLPLYAKHSVNSVRIPLEAGHLPSFVGSSLLLLRKHKFEGINFRLFGYPQKKHFRNPHKFRRVTRNGIRPVLVHPAAYDDFHGNPYGDRLTTERVTQFERLRDWEDF